MSQTTESQDIASRIRTDVLQHLKKNRKQTFRARELAETLDYADEMAYHLFTRVLIDLEHEDLVDVRPGGKYRFRPRPKKLEGRLSVTPNGYGFVSIPDRENDLFCREAKMGTALDGDLVRVGVMAKRRGDKRQECEVLEVLERKREKLVGTFHKKGHFAFVEPDDAKITQDVYVPKDAFNGAKNGQKVVVSIDIYEDRKASPEGRVLKVLGDGDDPNVRVLALAEDHDVRSDFPDEVHGEAGGISDQIPQSEIDRRLDLRDKTIFTIDPADAKDFDDAIHIDRLDNGNWEIGVHIADVSYYVRPDTQLDQEARQRATSVYLVDRVIPMLPERLSNGLCSLRPNEDKLAFSCIMQITPRGRLDSYEIVETVIHSKRRYTYDDAQQRIMGGFTDDPVSADVVDANRLAKTLTKKRLREGSVDFDLPEIRVELNEAGHPVDLYHKERKEANRLIEEFMLMANRAVAQHMTDGKHKKKAFVFRVHDEPDGERIRQLSDYVRTFNHTLELEDGNAPSKNLNSLLHEVKGTAEEAVIERAALRAMSKAVYSTDDIGHYGLGFEHYTHFTSPIRRYPDLLVHRLLKRYANGKSGVNKQEIESLCEHCSEREREAVVAERESLKLKQVEFIREHVGDKFEGVVSGVTKFGVFVEIKEMLVEGLVHVRDMDDDYYEYDEDNYVLFGAGSGKRYRPGDTVRVKVVGANLEKREIDLIFT